MIMLRNGCNVVLWKCYKYNYYLRNEFSILFIYELDFFWKWICYNIVFLFFGIFGIVILLVDDKCSCCC